MLLGSLPRVMLCGPARDSSRATHAVLATYLNSSDLPVCPALSCTTLHPNCTAESGLAASCLSSPHLRTNSVHDPPRSVVLLGKRGFDEEAGEPTPASKLRSVRQKTTEGATDLPFLLPQPLFTAGGSSGWHGYDGGLHSVERGDGRGGRGGKGGKKKAKEAPNRNRRKPQHAPVKQHQVRPCPLGRRGEGDSVGLQAHSRENMAA